NHRTGCGMVVGGGRHGSHYRCHRPRWRVGPASATADSGASQESAQRGLTRVPAEPWGLSCWHLAGLADGYDIRTVQELLGHSPREICLFNSKALVRLCPKIAQGQTVVCWIHQESSRGLRLTTTVWFRPLEADSLWNLSTGRAA